MKKAEKPAARRKRITLYDARIVPCWLVDEEETRLEHY